jgi:hypothetical protein
MGTANNATYSSLVVVITIRNYMREVYKRLKTPLNCLLVDMQKLPACSSVIDAMENVVNNRVVVHSPLYQVLEMVRELVEIKFIEHREYSQPHLGHRGKETSMGTVYQDSEKTTVRRRGGTDKVGHHLLRLGGDTVNFGDRRSRQIARRHWLEKMEVYRTSGSGGSGKSSKHPQRNEERQVLWKY